LDQHFFRHDALDRVALVAVAHAERRAPRRNVVDEAGVEDVFGLAVDTARAEFVFDFAVEPRRTRDRKSGTGVPAYRPRRVLIEPN
jgi:hypothetical protein